MPHDSAEDAFARGVRLFDAGAFFEAHEAWEERWHVETDETSRRLFQGLIQVAAGFHKLIAIGDRESAARLLAKGLAKLDACRDGAAGVSMVGFREAVRACMSAVERGELQANEVPKLGA